MDTETLKDYVVAHGLGEPNEKAIKYAQDHETEYTDEWGIDYAEIAMVIITTPEFLV